MDQKARLIRTKHTKKMKFIENDQREENGRATANNKSDDQLELKMNNGWKAEKAEKNVEKIIIFFEPSIKRELKNSDGPRRECRELDKNEIKTSTERILCDFMASTTSQLQFEVLRWIQLRKWLRAFRRYSHESSQSSVGVESSKKLCKLSHKMNCWVCRKKSFRTKQEKCLRSSCIGSAHQSYPHFCVVRRSFVSSTFIVWAFPISHKTQNSDSDSKLPKYFQNEFYCF